MVHSRAMTGAKCLTVGLAVVTILLSGCGPKAPEDVAADVVRKYLDAKSWEERVPFVRFPERIKPHMEKLYKNSTFPIKYLEIIPNEPTTRNSGEWVTVAVERFSGKNLFGAEVTEFVNYNLKKEGNSYLIDWESAVGHNEYTLSAYKAQTPSGPVKFRLMAKLADYYNYQFMGAEKVAYSVRLTEKRGWRPIYGYIPKHTAGGKKLFEVLKDGKEHEVIVLTKYSAETRDNSVVDIVEFIKEGWIEE